MDRRDVLKLAALGGAASLIPGCANVRPVDTSGVKRTSAFLDERDIASLRRSLDAGELSASDLSQLYAERIRAIDKQGPKLNAVIDLLPVPAAASSPHPLNGIPILLKDNIDTADPWKTTAGSLALASAPPPKQDAFIVRKLRAAGAVILGKTNLSEWANFRGSRSTSGWSAVGGLTRNPYALDRNPSGSSSGSAVAVSANLCAAAIGTETDGSIVSPANACGVVGLKPTVGLWSRSGIIPISKSQDTAGPMTRTVRDAAILLGALAGEDPDDPATEASRGKTHPDYTRFLSEDGLRGARVGVVRRMFRLTAAMDRVMEAALEKMRQHGAVLVDCDIATIGRFFDAEYQVMLYEFKDGLNAYLANRGGEVMSLADVIAFNERHADTELKWFGQEHMLRAQEKGTLTDVAYLTALERCRTLSRKDGIDATMDKDKLDALVAPTGGVAGQTDLIYGDRGIGGSSSIPAMAGYPNITVPAGQVHGLPVGMSFFGRAWSEPVILRIAYAFEQSTKARFAPRFLPAIA